MILGEYSPSKCKMSTLLISSQFTQKGVTVCRTKTIRHPRAGGIEREKWTFKTP